MRPSKTILMSLVLAASLSTGASHVRAADSTATSITATSQMLDEGGGVLKQVATGLQWAQSDNGSDIDWNAGRKFCADKGSGWRLPSVAELLSIYDKSGQVSTGCGPGFSCQVSPLFALTGTWGWSNEANNSATAWVVILTRGNTTAFAATDAIKKRALCVLGS